MKSSHGWIQGYNAQVLVEAGSGVIVAQEVTERRPQIDAGALGPKPGRYRSPGRVSPVMHVARSSLSRSTGLPKVMSTGLPNMFGLQAIPAPWHPQSGRGVHPGVLDPQPAEAVEGKPGGRGFVKPGLKRQILSSRPLSGGRSEGERPHRSKSGLTAQPRPPPTLHITPTTQNAPGNLQTHS